VNKIYLYISAN